MSRKAREDKSAWKATSCYVIVGGYGSFKFRGNKPLENAVLILTRLDNGNDGNRHALYSYAAQCQQALLRSEPGVYSTPRTIIVVDVHSLFETTEDYEEALQQETVDPRFTKRLIRPLLRLVDRLLLRNTTVVAAGALAPLGLKLAEAWIVQKSSPNAVQQVWLCHPTLSTEFCNEQLRPNATNKQARIVVVKFPVHIIFASQAAQEKRLDVVRHYYPTGKHFIHPSAESCLIIPLDDGEDRGNNRRKGENNDRSLPSATADYVDDQGKSLWFSQVSVEMNRYTKQYDRISVDITSDVWKERTPVLGEGNQSESTATVDWATCPREIGALVLRGPRCILIRSLKGEWKGMRIPTTVPQSPDETPVDVAIRSVVQHCEVDPDEVRPLSHIAPVSLYAPQGVLVTVYPLYAVQPPPEGPLEDQDMEDDESLYDWYTFENAVAKLDVRSRACLTTMACTLIEAANVGLLPVKWGGVFGQEIFPGDNVTLNNINRSTCHESIKLEVFGEDWVVSKDADVLQDVRKAKQTMVNRYGNVNSANGRKAIDNGNEDLLFSIQSNFKRSGNKLPVTILSGFLGSGKSSLMKHILTNYERLRVAILVNDMGEINIDAALLRGSITVRQREEHMVELSNGCICCTLREDLLTEVAHIASEGSFDYLLIESSGISEPLPVAETFTFTDSTGVCLGDIAYIDTMVTVVDGSRFFDELQTLESLQQRDWQVDAADERNISHLLCDQIDFANVVILNKCDMITVTEKDQVRKWIEQMNPTAKLVEAVHCAVPLDTVMGTGLFSMSEAEKHQRWLQEERIGEHTPETEEYGISSFTFRAARPFHPQRLWETLGAMSRHEPPFETILRCKGFVWLATRPELQGDFSLAGNHYMLLPGNPWWATIDKNDWPVGLEEAIAPLWHEPFGDRQQEIVVIGQRYDKDHVTARLRNCLLIENEMKMGQEEWHKLCQPDPFRESWDAAIESFMQQQHGHAHDHHHSEDFHHDHSHYHRH